MGEKQDTEQRSPSTGKRPSPTSVKELLDIVHLQQASVPLNVAVKQDADVLSTRGGFNPLPAIGKSSGSYPHVRNTSPPPPTPQCAACDDDETTRTRANSDSSQYRGTGGRRSALSSSLENGMAMPSIQSPRDETHHPVSSPAGRPAQQRRERILPPLSELKSSERPANRQRNVDGSHKTPLRRTASGDSQVRIPSAVRSSQGHEEHLQRPKSSHGRRRPLPSEIVAIHNSVPAPYEDEDVFSLDHTVAAGVKPARGSVHRDPVRPHNPAVSSRPRVERPKSSKGRTRRRIPTTGSLSQGDDWSSEEDMRPRAPSPPSPGLDSDLDSGNEGFAVSNGRNVQQR